MVKILSRLKKIWGKNDMMMIRSINFTSRYDIRTLTKLTTVANSKSNSVTELDHFLFLSDWIVMDRRMIPHLIIEPLCIFPVPDQHLNRIYFSRIISILLHGLHRTISNFVQRSSENYWKNELFGMNIF